MLVTPPILIKRLFLHWPSFPIYVALAAALLLALTASAVDMDRLFAVFSRLPKSDSALFYEWRKLVDDSQSRPVRDKLKRVNDFFNRHIQFSEDEQIWGQSDYWATPMETLVRKKGDCEDFTIAKYFTLLALNIPIDQLRLVYVKARMGGPSSNIQQAHMVLAYYSSPEAEPFVLDNLISEIRPASRRPDLQPVFSFNSQGIYSNIVVGTNSPSGSVGQLSRWQDLLQRAQAEGFD